MKANVTCEFNMDTGCVDILMPNEGVVIGIDCTAIENTFAENRFDRSELDYLIYNDPRAYAELVLSGDIDGYLKRVASNNRIQTASQVSSAPVPSNDGTGAMLFYCLSPYERYIAYLIAVSTP